MPNPRIHTRLTHERLRMLLDYRKTDGMLIWRVNRGRTAKAGDEAGAEREDGSVTVTIDGRSYLANRLAWMHVYGELPRGRLTAANGNLGDLRWSNIKLEQEMYSTTRAAAYQRERRRKQRHWEDWGNLRDFENIDPYDPRDPKNLTIYVPPRKRGRKPKAKE